ncbi:adenosylcobalamin/alpha-ribazole phosphatase-like [Oratosquilla oratoria]|uniref:adenosylcobalamin/alpha-ribazole phosphatase-like n=1 Tax=Oratosquilla oratoria TaxID=337810 RepID=UPI003F77055E
MQQQWPTPLADEWHQRQWLCSPLSRARQTAEYFQLQAKPEPALIEMHWGDWEGKRLSELRAQDPAELQRIEAQGLHLRAPSGESPAEVITRLSEWADALLPLQGELALGAVSHKGVIRALLAAATGWDMLGKPPERLDYRCGQLFRRAAGRWALVQANVPLSGSSTQG